MTNSPTTYARRLQLVLAILATVSAGSAQEISRHVPSGREVHDSKLLTLGKTDRWDLKVKAGDILWCKVESSLFDPVLELVDSDGVVLASNDGEGTKSALWQRVKVQGPVSFKVRGFEGSGGGLYKFWLRRYHTQDVSLDQHVKHRFGPEQWWHYVVPLKSGDVVVPTCEEAGRITAVYGMDQKHVRGKMGGYRVENDGLYLIRVEGRERRTCKFHCTLARQRALPSDGKKDLVPAHGFDIWSLQLRQGEAYALEVLMPAAQLEFELWEPHPRRGVAFAYTGSLDKGGRKQRWLVARRDCSLELLLRNPGGEGGPYRTGLTQPEQALVDGASVAATLPLGGGDLYRLPTVPGQLLRVSMESSAFDGKIDLWGPGGSVLVSCDDASPMERNPSFTFLVVRPGRHRAIVYSPHGSGGGAYSLRVESLPVPQLCFDKPLKLQVAKLGTSYCPLELARDTEVWLSVRGQGFDVALTVLAPNGEVVGSWEGGGVGKDVLAAMKTKGGGRYTLQVHSRDKQGGCTLQVVRP